MTNQSAGICRPRRARRSVALLALTLLGATLAAGTARAQWTQPAAPDTNIHNTNAGNVGVGTGATAPTEQLVVNGNTLGGQITARTKLYSSYDSQANSIFELGYGTATPLVTPYASLVLSKNLTAGNNLIGALNFANSSIADGSEKRVASILGWTGQTTTSGSLSFYTMGGGTLVERMRLNESGNLGLGTATPLNQLHVDSSALGGIRVSGVGAAVLNFEDKGAASGQRLYQWRSEGGAFRMSLAADDGGSLVRQNILVANSAGNVGVGTATPFQSFAGVLNLGGGGLHLKGPSVARVGVEGSLVAVLNLGVSGAPADRKLTGIFANQEGKIGFLGSSDAGVDRAPAMTVDTYGGSVGVGTTSPDAAYKLDVAGAAQVGGNLHVTGNITGANIQATYQDVAEWVPSVQKFSAGTVVVLDTRHSNHVLASTTAYDTRVAGVVSARPGIALGEGGEGKALVATTGRVKVKVDASRAPVRIGDLLVTSDVEGVAMRSEPVSIGGRQFHAPGTIIGKALEPLEKGTGEILVLLSLQ